MSFSRRQRQQLLTLMRAVGPLAPTACEGWQVQDLAAHLWVREHRLDALPGIGNERFAATTQRVQMDALHSKGFDGLLQDLQRPAGLMAVVDPLVNGTEYYIHHEDVARANGRAVPLGEGDQRYLLRIALVLAWKTARTAGVRLVVTPTGGESRSFGSGRSVVHVDGAPNELLLHFSGREANVSIIADDVDAYKAAVGGL